LFFIFAFACLHGQTQTELRPKIQEIVNRIERYNILDPIESGSPQWSRYLQLLKKSNIEELRILTDHRNEVVRCYAYQALIDREDAQVFDIMLQHLYDTAYVTLQYSDIKVEERVGDFFLLRLRPWIYEGAGSSINEDQKNKLDSLLLFLPEMKLSYAKFNVYMHLSPREEYYAIVRTRALLYAIPTAYVALAKYRLQNDVQYIHYFLHDPNERAELKASIVREFPIEEFYPYLIELLAEECEYEDIDEHNLIALYQAFLQYPTRQTEFLLTQCFESANEKKQQKMSILYNLAAIKYPHYEFEALDEVFLLDEKGAQELKRRLKYEY
jgi:hypothetical protein